MDVPSRTRLVAKAAAMCQNGFSGKVSSQRGHMAEKHVGNVSVPITEQDRQAIADVLESSPFKQDIMLKLALRIGLDAIAKDPTVLMPFLAKKASVEG